MPVGVSVSVSNNVIDDDEQNNPTNNANGTASAAVVSGVALSGPSVSNNTDNNSPGRFLLHANFPNLFESNNINRHDESVSGNGDASNESATPGK